MAFTFGGCDVGGGTSGGRMKCVAGSEIGGCMVGGTGWPGKKNQLIKLKIVLTELLGVLSKILSSSSGCQLQLHI